MEYLCKSPQGTILTQGSVSQASAACERTGKRERRSVWGDAQNDACRPVLVNVKTWIEGWGHVEGICQVWGMESERYKTERNEIRSTTDKKSSKIKRTKKEKKGRSKKLFLLRW